MSPLDQLATRAGIIRFPAFIPVTTFGERFPLDELVRPYLRRLAPAVMVSAHYARRLEGPLGLPLLLDSGGYAALAREARVVESSGGLGLIERRSAEGEVSLTHPRDVLDLQERSADVAFSLDFPVPPGTDPVEAERRLALTVANAHFALENRRRRDLPLYACVQGWDVESVRRCARSYASAAFDGLALGGLVPRARDVDALLPLVDAARDACPDLPLHLLGLGEPALLARLFERGVQSVDSSSYVRLAAAGRLWGGRGRIAEPSALERLHLALCNLAAATGAALPLSAAPLLFRTQLLARALDDEDRR